MLWTWIFLGAISADVPATLTSCYDGDTCRFDIHLEKRVELGFGLTQNLRTTISRNIRFYDADAPERHDPGGKGALEWVKQQMRGKTVTLRFYLKDNCDDNFCERRSFTRYLAYVMVDGENLSEKMITSGIGRRAEKTCK